MRDILDKLFCMSGIDIEPRLDQSRQGPADMPILVGSSEELKSDTDWRLTVPLDQTLSNVYSCHLVKLSAEISS